MREKERRLRAFMQEVWNEKQLERVGYYLHSEYTIHLDTADPWEGKTLSHEDFKVRLQYSFNSFPDIHFEITDSIEEENHVAITWILTGTNLGPIGEYPPTGRSIRVRGQTIYHFKEGLISGHTQVFDRNAVVEQLGFGQD